MKHKTLNKLNNLNIEYEFNYQKDLTEYLDSYEDDFNQSTIDKIVLWKTNRYAELDKVSIDLLNRIKTNSKKINIELTKDILTKLLNTKGIRLAMASTILRFKNPNIYQIIDQRAFRIINKEELIIPSRIEEQINLYLKYLDDLNFISKEYDLEFKILDRFLYTLDKKHNKDIKIKY